MTIRAGDTVLHLKSGEKWVVAAVEPNGQHLCPMGWPESIALTEDCQLLEAASDEQHQQTLLEVLKPGDVSGIRDQWAFENLLVLHGVYANTNLKRLQRHCSRAYEAYQNSLNAVRLFKQKIRSGELLPTKKEV